MQNMQSAAMPDMPGSSEEFAGMHSGGAKKVKKVKKGKKAQKGGNDLMPMPMLESEHFTNLTDIPSLPGASEGGSKKTKKTKKSSKSGGALVDDMKNLAVPFAILLAKQGIQGMFNKKDSASKSSSKSKKVDSMPMTMAKKKSKTQKGGDCGSCGSAEVVPAAGGSRAKMTRYAQLSKEIDDFLSKY